MNPKKLLSPFLFYVRLNRETRQKKKMKRKETKENDNNKTIRRHMVLSAAGSGSYSIPPPLLPLQEVFTLYNFSSSSSSSSSSFSLLSF